MLKIDALPAFTDNYIWLLQDPEQRTCVAVDPGDAGPVQAWLDARRDWRLTDILITHHHHDHVGGVLQLKERHGAKVHGPAEETIPGRDNALTDGQSIEVLGHRFEVIEVPGHTSGHIAYYHDDPKEPLLLSGDTLFAAGCGRLFEGTAAQMFSSLQRLAALPANTRIYCTHEYTLSNLRFAQAVEPDNPEIGERLEQVIRLRDAKRITLPSELRIEHATNPFLRSAEGAVAAAASRHAGRQLDTPENVFAALRAWKDSF
ncbi:hydroxyacylglutathione hydrolase [Pseudomonas stutzeri]|uniref:Hydroxyacylglutathione hydrolase n=1 Tax=Stutzerimonas stutzeri TaxID=316 RepID=A0A2N8SYI2_STUST|nr:hydroxyacylglutathione hydrolase [Stutzerimonas stutzeri]EQM75535.1 hydroxyacylglutathione hydrolase [Stutzerimonas stutzeri MF28]MCI0916934.1 hydroxyacylglutathione hydrolase [Stutzerimonas stutzeri]MCQ4249581.1 hydroxyacylglutathione hydrolase [Stutzerimonas stutzeri]PNG07544.1 hydroxyacylglutathione hydrolase [Stutzerimonas stutzeri]